LNNQIKWQVAFPGFCLFKKDLELRKIKLQISYQPKQKSTLINHLKGIQYNQSHTHRFEPKTTAFINEEFKSDSAVGSTHQSPNK
jgi:hypothetical protein